MKLQRTILWSCALALAWSALSASESQAYIDLGSGSYIFQVVIASVLGGAFALKAYWRKLRGLFNRHREDNNEE